MTLHAGSGPVLRNMCRELRLIPSRAWGLATVVPEAKRCPVRLWETESQQAPTVTETPTVLTESKRSRPSTGPRASEPSSRSCQQHIEGRRSRREEEADEASNGCPHVSHCCFRPPWGRLRVALKSAQLISAHMLVSVHERWGWGLLLVKILSSYQSFFLWKNQKEVAQSLWSRCRVTDFQSEN